MKFLSLSVLTSQYRWSNYVLCHWPGVLITAENVKAGTAPNPVRAHPEAVSCSPAPRGGITHVFFKFVRQILIISRSQKYRVSLFPRHKRSFEDT